MFYFINIFSDFRQTNYLNIYQTDLHEICTTGRTLAVDERPEGTLPWQPILCVRSTSNIQLVLVRGGAPSAGDRRGPVTAGALIIEVFY